MLHLDYLECLDFRSQKHQWNQLILIEIKILEIKCRAPAAWRNAKGGLV